MAAVSGGIARVAVRYPSYRSLGAVTWRGLVVAGALLALVLIGAGTAAADVAPTGAFQTSVAIKVPPFHGLEPRLGLVYSSSGSSGWVGAGWSLSGLSSIRRQSSTGGVPHWDAGDTFALDGLDLLACPASNDASSLARSPSCAHQLPGLVGYTTRVESYQRIARKPPGGGEPERWLVWKTDGVKATFEPGLTTTQGTLGWLLTKVEDLSGNTVNYEWQGPPRAHPELRFIRYGDVQIGFQSEPRPDPITVATGAGLDTNTRRLRVIDQLAGGQRIRAYALRYKTNFQGSRRSFLQSVQEYGSDAVVDAAGVHGETALPATTFNSSPTGSTAAWTRRRTAYVPDWAADWPAGPDDSARFNVPLSGGNQGVVPWSLGEHWPNGQLRDYHAWTTLDFNGDGRTDFALIQSRTGQVLELHVELAQPDGGYQGVHTSIPWKEQEDTRRSANLEPMVGDVDGDGMADITVAALGSAALTMFGNDALVENLVRVSHSSNQYSLGVQFDQKMGDVTGDGLADVVTIGKEYAPANGVCPGQVHVFVGTGSGTFNLSPSATRAGCWPELESPRSVPTADFQLTDVNGDLKTDLVGFQKADIEGPHPLHDARIFTAIADGTGGFSMQVKDTKQAWAEEVYPEPGFECPGFPGHRECVRTTVTDVPAFWSDADGDGRSDLVVLRLGGKGEPNGTAEAWTAYSQGDGSYRPLTKGSTPFLNKDLQKITIEYPSGNTTGKPGPRWLTADFNGDGAGDLGRVVEADKGAQQTTLRALADRQGNWVAKVDSETTWRCSAGCGGYPTNPDRPFTATGDINGDGQDDVLFAHSLGGPEPLAALGADPTLRVPAARQLLSGDVNADGRQDLLYPTMTPGGVQVRVWRQRADGTYERVPPRIPPVVVPWGQRLTQRGWLVADVNCDRRTDLVNLDTDITVLLATGDDWQAAPSAPLLRGGRWSVADVNGDDCADLVRVSARPAGVYVMLGKPDGSWGYDDAETPADLSKTELSDTLHWQPLDVDGDGQADLVHVNGQTGDIDTLLRRNRCRRQVSSDVPSSPPPADLDCWRRVPSHVPSSPNPPDILAPDASRGWILSIGGDEPTWRGMDVNADGAQDLVRVSVDRDGAVLVETLSSRGDGTYRPRTQRIWSQKAQGGPQAGADGQRWVPADIDHDGRGDLVRVFNRGAELIIQALLSDGDGLWVMRTGPGSQALSPPATSSWRVVDWDGSGQTNAVRLDASSSVLTVSGLTSTAPLEVISHINNGLGASTKVDYSPGTSMLPSGETTPPECRLPAGSSATPVVVKLTTSDTPTGTSDTTTTPVWAKPGLGVPPPGYACPQYSKELRSLVAWAETRSTHEAAANRPASTEHVVRDVNPSGIVQPVLDELTDAHGSLLRETRSHYEPRGEQPQIDLLAGTTVNNCSAGLCATSSVALAHDGFGNIIGTTERPAGSDRRRQTDTTYLYDHARWLHALPRSSRTVDPTEPDQLLRASLVCYDGDTSADCTQPPGQPRGQPRGLATLTRAWDDTTGTGRFVVTSQAGYDPFGNQTASTDANNHTITTEFDQQLHLHPIKVCNALDQCSWQPEPWDRRADAPTLLIDVNKAETRQTYDPLGRPDTTELPSGAVDTVTYQTDRIAGTATYSATSAPNIPAQWTRTFTDGLGRTYLRERPGGDGPGIVQSVTEYSDGSTRPYRSAAPHFTGDPPVWEVFTYDAAGRSVQQTHADGTSLSTRYFVRDGSTGAKSRDETGRVQTHLTDGWGALTLTEQPSVTPGAVARTRYSYNAVGDLKTVTDPAGNIIRNDFDTLGRKTAEDDPDRGRTRYRYDLAGNLRHEIDARRRKLAYDYDELNRPILKKDLATGAISSWHYDEPGHGASVGRLTSVRDLSAAGCRQRTSHSLTYDTNGNITEDTRCVRGTTQTFGMTYDPLNRLDTLTYPDRQRLTYGYDGAGHLSRVSGYVLDLQYNARDQLISADYANHTSSRWSHDHDRGWLDSQEVTTSNSRRLFDDTVTRDPAGLVSTATSRSNRTAETYGYDPLGRLTGVTGSWQQQLAYDDLGNITSNSRVGTYTYPSHRRCVTQSNRQQCAGPHAVTTAGNTSYEYDEAGNMTAIRSPYRAGPRVGKQYIVRSKQRGKRRDTLWALAADHLGDPRRWPEIYALNLGHPYPKPPGGRFVDSHWIYPGQRLLLPAATARRGAAKASSRQLTWNTDGQLTQVHDSRLGDIVNLFDADGARVQQRSRSGITNFYGPLAEWTPKTGLTKYIYAGPLLVGRHRGTQQLWYTLDRLGSSRLTTNQTGRVATRQNYAPYGETAGRTGKAEPIGYTGRRTIGDTDLIDMLARAYDPHLARMLSADTIIPDLSNPQALNRYSYAYNNPANYTDPTGHFPIQIQESGVTVDGRNLYGMFGEERLIGATFHGGQGPVTTSGDPIFSTERISAAWMRTVPSPTPTVSCRSCRLLHKGLTLGGSAVGMAAAPPPSEQAPRTAGSPSGGMDADRPGDVVDAPPGGGASGGMDADRPGDVVDAQQGTAEDELPPLLRTGAARARAIMANVPGRIHVANNPRAHANPNPWYARSSAAEVIPFNSLIEDAAMKYGLDPDLARAAIWMETTHGWYDAVTGVIREPKTLRPMNVHVEFWRDLGLTRESLNDPRTNVEAGVYILASIASRLEDPTPEKIFTLYNNLSADRVSDYGKTAADYYSHRPWIGR